MENLKPNYRDEIDFIDVVHVIWDGKWIIIGTSFFSLLIVLIFQSLQPPSKLQASTEVKPIKSSDIHRYREFNSLGFLDISPSMLLDLYVEQLDKKELFIEAVKRHDLLDKEAYSSAVEYDEAIEGLVSKIIIQKPVELNNTDGNPEYWNIVFEHTSKEQWKKTLLEVNKLANAAVRKAVKDSFYTSLKIAKMQRKFKTEDLDVKIDNSFDDYDRKIAGRLEFLREQASIARKLGVAKNTLEGQVFNASNGIVTNLKTDTPFYLRGYSAIEEEIKLIESRVNKEAFVEGLFELQQEKRALEQDKLLSRVEALFPLIPLVADDEFDSVFLSVDATEFVKKGGGKVPLMLSVFFGILIGVFYALINAAIRKRNEV